MRDLRYRHIGMTMGMVALTSAALVFGGHSFIPSSHASNPATSPATSVAPPIVVAPANGFTEVAKLVTPAVVNITTVTTEKVSAGRSMPDDLRDRMEEFFGKPFGPRGR